MKAKRNFRSPLEIEQHIYKVSQLVLEGKLNASQAHALVNAAKAWARQIEEGDNDDRLSKYPRELFEPKPEPLRETAVDGVSDAGTGTTTPESGKCLKSPVDGVQTPLQEFNYSEVKRSPSIRPPRMRDVKRNMGL